MGPYWFVFDAVCVSTNGFKMVNIKCVFLNSGSELPTHFSLGFMGQSHLDVLADECATHKEFGQNVGERRTRYKDVMHSLRNVVIRRACVG